MTETVEGAPSAGGNGEAARSDAFISYSHHDRAFAMRLRTALEGRGQNIWLDESEIHGGSRWSDELERAIDGADTFVFLISPDSASSPECGKELEHAIELSKRILPIRVRETPLEGLPEGLTAYQLIPARELFDSNFEQSLEQLVTEIEVDRDWVREHTDWNEKAREWQKHDRNSSYLLAGAELDLAEGFRGRSASKQPGLSALQNEYIDASRQGATRRLRRTRGFVSVALVVAIALSVVALIQRQHAISEQHSATSGALSADSVLQEGTDPQLSLLLAAQAAKASETPAALDALRRAIPANHLIRTFEVDHSAIDSAELSPDGSELLTVSEDGYARIWDVATGTALRRFPMSTSYEQGGMFDRSGRELVTWVLGKVQIWNLDTPGAPPVTITGLTLSQLEMVAISPDDSMIATASGPGDTGSYTLWNARTGKLLHTLEVASANDNMGGDIAFSPNSQLVATGSENGVATVWNARTGRLEHVLDVSEGASESSELQNVATVAFSPDGTRLLTSAGLPPIQQLGATPVPEETEVWNVANETVVVLVNGADGAWDGTGKFIVTTSADGTVRVWSATATEPVIAQMKASYPITGQALFGADASGQPTIVLTGSAGGYGGVWNAISSVQLETLAGEPGSVEVGGFSSDGSRVLTYSNDGAARLWGTGAATATPVRVSPVLRSPNLSVLTPESNFLDDPSAPLLAVSSNLSGVGGIEILDAHTGAVAARLPAVPDLAYDKIAFDNAGTKMLVMSDHRTIGSSTILPAQIRDAHGGALLHTLSGSGALAVSGLVSPDGTLAATVNARNAITVWAVASGRSLVTFTRHINHAPATGSESVVFKFSADGKLMFSSDDDGWTYVWQARTGRVLNVVHGIPEPAGQHAGWGGAISPDDKLVVTVASWDSVAHVYRVGDPREVIELQGSQADLDDASFSPDSGLLATISGDGIELWDTRSESPILSLLGTYGQVIQFTAAGQSFLTDEGTTGETLPCVVCGGFPQVLAAARARETRSLTPAERALYLGGG